jgi:protein TonB
MGRACGPPSLLQELEHDSQEQEAARKNLATRPAWPVKSAPPHYPQELWDAMVEGSVVIEGRIGEDGVPTALEVVAPVHPDFAKEALDTVSQWRFEPARRDGSSLSVPLRVTINFRLSGARARLPGAE